jgi:hypothetical protein
MIEAKTFQFIFTIILSVTYFAFDFLQFYLCSFIITKPKKYNKNSN